MKNKLLTAKELAKIYNIHPYTLKRLARQGKIAGAVKVGGQWRFKNDPGPMVVIH